MESGVEITNALAEFNIDTKRWHQELLELIASQSASINNASSVGVIYEFCSCCLILLLRLEGVP
jgi:hypothetical protein